MPQCCLLMKPKLARFRQGPWLVSLACRDVQRGIYACGPAKPNFSSLTNVSRLPLPNITRPIKIHMSSLHKLMRLPKEDMMHEVVHVKPA